MVEKKVAAGSVAAFLVALLSPLGVKYLHLDNAYAVALATAIVTYVITFAAGYVAKHTKRPELEAEAEQMLGMAGDAEANVDPEPEVDEEPADDEENVPDLAQPAA